MIGVLSTPPVSSLKDLVHHCSNVKHSTVLLDLCVNLITVLRKQGHELIEDEPGGQGIVCLRAVNLLALPLNPADFLVKHPRPIPESFLASLMLPIERGVVPHEAAPSSDSSLDALESSCWPRCLFHVALSASQANWAARAISASASLAISSMVWLGSSPYPTRKTSWPPSKLDPEYDLWIGSTALGQLIPWWSTQSSKGPDSDSPTLLGPCLSCALMRDQLELVLVGSGQCLTG
jgi:hypothetical protein